jgi:hypothetical protein
MTMCNLQLPRSDLNAPKHDVINSTSHFRTNKYFFLLWFSVIIHCQQRKIKQAKATQTIAVWSQLHRTARKGGTLRYRDGDERDKVDLDKRGPVVIKVRLPEWYMPPCLWLVLSTPKAPAESVGTEYTQGPETQSWFKSSVQVILGTPGQPF